MVKQDKRPLKLEREVIQVLDGNKLALVAGGGLPPSRGTSCLRGTCA